MDHVADAARQVLDAVTTFAPDLWWKVIAVSAGYIVIVLCGHALTVVLGGNSHTRRSAVDFPDWMLASFTAGTLYTLFLMYALGTAHAFRPLTLWIGVCLPVAAALTKNRFGVTRQGFISPREMLAIVLVTTGPVLVALTCPVPSWNDVLEIDVAPVQRLLTFATYDPATALPSALYPLNRATPLFTSFHAVVAGLFGLKAYEELAAAIVPTLLVTLVAVYQLARALLPNERLAGFFAMIAWPLSYNYVHLQDSRSTGWHIIFALIAITKAIELLDDHDNHRTLIVCSGALAAAVLVHPLEGMFTVVAVFLIVAVAFQTCSQSAKRDYGLAALASLSLMSPLAWSWHPHSPIGLPAVLAASVGGVVLLLVLRSRSGEEEAESSNNGFDSRLSNGLLRWAPLFAVLSAVLLRWDFYGPGRRSFLLHQLVRYPVPTGLSIVAVFISFPRLTRTSFLAAVTLFAASLPLWAFPWLNTSPLDAASFRYELPLKGMDFWLSSVSCITAAAVLTALWSRGQPRRVARLFVIALVALPTAVLLRLPTGPEHRAAGLIGMSRWQLKLAANGYWKGWGDARFIVSRDERDLFAKLGELVRSGRITAHDRIAHIAPATNLTATPFPAFTGISQDLYLPHVDTANIHTHGGRLFDMHTQSLPRGWILVERSAQPLARFDSASVVYENERAVLLYHE